MADLSSLVIRLSADVASLQSDLGKAVGIAQRSSDQMVGAFQKAGGIVKEFAAGIAAAFTIDKIAEVGKAAIDLGDNLNKMSQKVGVSVESLSALRNVGQLADASFEQLGAGMVKLARTAADAAAGGKEQAAAFAAIGVAVKDSTGNLRPMQSILEDVSKKMAGYEDSAAKTALATRLFGKSGAELIPVLNQLGTEGFEAVTQAARDYNQVIGREQAQQSEQFNDNLSRLSMAASGFANALVKEMLPGLVAVTNTMAEGSKTNDGYAQSAGAVSTAVKSVVLTFIAAKEIVQGLVTVVLGLGDVLGAVGDVFNGFAKGVGNDLTAIGEAMRGNFTAAREALNSAGTSLTDGWAKASIRVRAAWSAVQSGVGDSVADTKKAYNDLFGEFSNVASGADMTAGSVKKLQAPLVDVAAKAKMTSDAFLSLREHVEKLAGGFGGPYQKAQADYAAGLLQLQKMAEKAAIAGGDVNEIIKLWQKGEEYLGKTLAQTNKQIKDQHDLIGNQADQMSNLIAIQGLAPKQQEAMYDALQKYDELMKSHYDFYGNYIEDETKLRDALDKQIPIYARNSQAINDINEQIQKSKQLWSSWADTIFEAVTKGGNFLKNLLGAVKQIVTEILREWFRTRVVGMFAGGGGGYGGLVQAGLGLVTGGGGLGGSAGAVADFTSSASGGTQFSIMSPSSWISAGKSLWQGFTGAGNAMPGSTMLGTWSGNGSVMSMPGGGYANLPTATGGTYAPSTFGYLAAGAAGIYAGYNRFQNSNKDFGGALGGVAYGVGTYGAAIGAGAALTGGMAAGLAAVPVVGWIALAAMAVDYLSGGKLFGTKGKLDHSNMSLDVGAEGFNLAQSYTLKGQKAFFGGTKWTTNSVQASPEAIAAAQDFYDALVKNRDQFAKQFNAQVGDLVGGTYNAQFDKKGNLTSQSTTVLGVTYKDETQEQFAQRLTSENMIAVLSQFDTGLSALADSFRKNVDALSQFANAAAISEAALQGGAQILALGSDQTLTAFLKLAEGVQGMGETIDQTVQRLLQAQAQYDQFVGQFKPAATYVDDFEASLAQISAQMQANIKQANALARAAGAEGAATSDLTNIMQYAAQQQAAALKQLQQSAQTLAFNLGISNVGSLDQISAEIERLQGKANAGAHAVSGFGGAMQAAAQRANDAIQLLIGDLSPLNDMQKLEEARKGLMAGQVSQDQFLQIAHRLYASSAQYEREFAFAQQFPGQRGGGGGGRGGGGAGSAAQGLTSEESARLAELLKQQQQLQAAAQLQQFQTLAQQIAEIASFQGVDYQQVIENMGIDLKGLEAGLGLANDDALKAYIETRQAQLDSEGNNTQSIVSKLDEILQQLRSTSNGGTVPVGDHSTGAHDAPFSDGPAHSSRGRGDSNQELADAIGDAVGRVVLRYGEQRR